MGGCLNGNATQFQQVPHPGQHKLDLTTYKEMPKIIKLRMSGRGGLISHNQHRSYVYDAECSKCGFTSQNKGHFIANEKSSTQKHHYLHISMFPSVSKDIVKWSGGDKNECHTST